MVSAQWLQACQRGDFQAFAWVVRTYQQRLFVYIKKLTGNHHLAEDIVQETFVRAFRKIEQYEPSKDLGSWLYRIAHNLAMDSFRRDARNEQVQQRQAWTSKPIDIPIGAHQQLENRDRAQRLEAALAELPDRTREIFLLHYFSDKSVRQIAYILDIPVGTVLAQLSRGRKKLRTILTEAKDELS